MMGMLSASWADQAPSVWGLLISCRLACTFHSFSRRLLQPSQQCVAENSADYLKSWEPARSSTKTEKPLPAASPCAPPSSSVSRTSGGVASWFSSFFRDTSQKAVTGGEAQLTECVLKKTEEEDDDSPSVPTTAATTVPLSVECQTFIDFAGSDTAALSAERALEAAKSLVSERARGQLECRESVSVPPPRRDAQEAAPSMPPDPALRLHRNGCRSYSTKADRGKRRRRNFVSKGFCARAAVLASACWFRACAFRVVLFASEQKGLVGICITIRRPRTRCDGDADLLALCGISQTPPGSFCQVSGEDTDSARARAV